jgi:DnaJ-class molecular chaperone
MNAPDTTANHYATLGLDRDCSFEQIRAAYRALAKQVHPDVNHGQAGALSRTQALNAAYEVLSDAEHRRRYDASRLIASSHEGPVRSRRPNRNISQDVSLRIDDFLRGVTLEVRVNDPANQDGPESYDLNVPANTAPGARLRLPRHGGGFLVVRVRARPDFRFKVSGSNLRCDLRISSQRALQGGTEMISGVTGRVRVNIPRGAERGEIIRIPGEGLPRPRGGRGELLVRITYRPEIHITRASRR